VQFALFTVLLSTALTLGCRAKHKSQGDEVPPPPGGIATADSAAALVPAPLPPQLPELKQPELLRGFGFKGESTCFPLAAGRRCIPANESPIAHACRQAKGEILTCEDCRQVCSRMLKP